MARRGSPVFRSVDRFHLYKVASFVNRILIQRLGVRITAARTQGVAKGHFDRLLWFQRLLSQLEGVEGDIVECGVASGHSLAMLASLVRSSNRKRHLWGFDSWEGLPEPEGEDEYLPDSRRKRGMFGETSIERVKSTFTWYGFDRAGVAENITLVRGWFSETTPGYAGPEIALLHLDGDLYTSYKDPLEALWPRLAVGGIAALDEYQQEAWSGARRAVDEFLSGLPAGVGTLHEDKLSRRYYIVKHSSDLA